MIFFFPIYRMLLLSAIVLLAVSPAQADDLRCDFIFSGPSAAVSAEGEVSDTGEATLRFSFGGYAQCTSPESFAWKSFADSNASDRQITITVLQGDGRRALVEQRLKDCHRQALLAMSNPARYVFSLSIVGSESLPSQPGALVRADSATAVGCSLGANSTGLK